MTLDLLRGLMLAAVGVNACCLLGSRHSRNTVTIVSTVLMTAAMIDVSFALLGIPPLAWTCLLLAWSMLCAAALRRRTANTATPTSTHAGNHQLHHLLGLIVLGGQLAGHPAAATAVRTGAHSHSSSLLLAVVVAGAAAYTLWSLALLLHTRQPRSERGALASMSAMTVCMGLMPFL
ncbi:hypothetical protein [Cryobacterium psychrophilum]|uniref:Uncharacterized protein n=1 Tax=Cryobacterium psychrophilum TaxID=41988 RepID=A0A4Y8KX91_9MICO|nr:hypothetical protein [Cryobacterium psychrophilum]TDW29381.1 hypothetical protein EDD25_1075 [Cryobacterium psychrophilum]TFD81472.1 hypothetical protein E3T53_03155 [Cryobacterium psychrophilum]